MRRFLYDTSIFVYALGGARYYREPCREILDLAGRGELEGEASVDLLQEFAHQRRRQSGDAAEAAQRAREVAALCRLHELRPDDASRGLDLFERHPSLSARDAIFAALALNRGIDAILSTDRGFEQLDALERIDPADQEAVTVLRRKA